MGLRISKYVWNARLSLFKIKIEINLNIIYLIHIRTSMVNSIAKTAANKRWYENNKEKHNAICAPHSKNYQKTHAVKILAKKRGKYALKICWESFRNIDLFDI